MTTAYTAYLERLGAEVDPPSIDALRRLHRAHVERIPYDTFWVFLGQEWGVDPEECVARFASTRRGGYCFQLNSAFYALLRELGYQVSLNAAGVYDEPTPDVDVTNHAAIIAEGLPTEENPGGRWWVDVGLGDALYDPLPLVEGDYVQGPLRFTMEIVEPGGAGHWRLVHDPAGWFAGVQLVDAPVEPEAFEERHHHNATAPDSGYAKLITALRRHEDGITLVRGCVLVRIGQDGTTKHTCESQEEWLEVLDREFDLVFDGVSDQALQSMWDEMRRAHEEWLQSRRGVVNAGSRS